MAFLKWLLDAMLDALVTGVNQFIADKRREAKLEELGYDKRVIEGERAKIDDFRLYASLQAHRARDRAELASRLRALAAKQGFDGRV